MTAIKTANLFSKFFDTFTNSTLSKEDRADIDFFLNTQSRMAYTGGAFELLFLDKFILDEPLIEEKREIDTIIALPAVGSNWITNNMGSFDLEEIFSATKFHTLFSAEKFDIPVIETMEKDSKTLLNGTGYTFNATTNKLELLREKIEATLLHEGKYYLRIPNLNYNPNVIKDKVGVLLDFTDTSIDFYDNRVRVLKNYAIGAKTKGNLANTINNLYLNNFILEESETILAIDTQGVTTDKHRYTFSNGVPPNPKIVDPNFDITDPDGYIGIGKTFPKYTPISVVGVLEDTSNTLNWYRGFSLDKDIFTKFNGIKDVVMDDSTNAQKYQQELYDLFTTFYSPHFVNFRFYKNAANFDQGKFSITNIEKILYHYTPVDLKIYVTASSANEVVPPYTWYFASKFITTYLPSIGTGTPLGARVKETITDTWYFASKFITKIRGN